MTATQVRPAPKAHLLFAVLAVLTCLVYWPGLFGGYLFDDIHTVERNPWIRISDLDLEALRLAAGSFLGGGRELSMLSLAINHLLTGADASGFKTGNLAFHLLTGFAIYLLGRRLLAAPGAGGDDSAGGYAPALLAGLWLLHPINLTSVLYVSQRMTILATLFVVTGLLVYVKGRRMRIGGARGGLVLCAVSLPVFAVLAYKCKENGVLLLPLAALVEWVLFGFRNGQGRLDRGVVVLIALLCLAPLVAGLVWLLVDPGAILGGYRWRHFDVRERLLTQARALWLYAGLIVLPRIGALGFWHDDFAVSRAILEPVTTLFSVLALVAVVVLAVVWWRRAPLVAFGIAWFLIAHSLESSIIPLELVHEHRNYLAGFGLLVALLGAVRLLPQTGRVSKTVIVLAALVAFTSVTVVRARHFANPFLLAQMEVAHHPDSANAHYALGQLYFRAARAGLEEAAAGAVLHVDRAAALEAYHALPDVGQAINSALLGVFYSPAWLQRAAAKVERHPALAPTIAALKQLLECLTERRCRFPVADTDAVFDAAARSGHAPALAVAGFYFANVRQDHARAATIFREAVRLSPDEPAHRLNLASLMVAVGDADGARRELDLVKAMPRRSTFRYQGRIARIEADLRAGRQ